MTIYFTSVIIYLSLIGVLVYLFLMITSKDTSFEVQMA